MAPTPWPMSTARWSPSMRATLAVSSATSTEGKPACRRGGQFVMVSGLSVRLTPVFSGFRQVDTALQHNLVVTNYLMCYNGNLQCLNKCMVSAPKFYSFRVILHSYDYNMHVEATLATLYSPEQCSQFEMSHQQHVQMVNTTSSSKTTLSDNNAEASIISGKSCFVSFISCLL